MAAAGSRTTSALPCDNRRAIVVVPCTSDDAHPMTSDSCNYSGKNPITHVVALIVALSVTIITLVVTSLIVNLIVNNDHPDDYYGETVVTLSVASPHCCRERV